MPEVRTSDGHTLSWRAAGDPNDPPLVLLHGWAQSSGCWGPALDLLARTHHVIAPDLRGHGRSDAPAAGYDDPVAWAADLDAVLAAEGVDRPPVLLGWSYGGLVACDWLQQGGVAAGLVLVGAITAIGRGRPGGRIGSGMRAALPDGLADDPVLAVPALTAFATGLTDDGPTAQALLGASLQVPPRVRAALFDRACDHDATLAGFGGPALVLHGEADTVVDVSAGEHAAGLLPQGQLSRWVDTGHVPFLTDPARFAGEVAGLVP